MSHAAPHEAHEDASHALKVELLVAVEHVDEEVRGCLDNRNTVLLIASSAARELDSPWL